MNMVLFRCIVAVATLLLLVACAAGTPQSRLPEHLRAGDFYLHKGAALFKKGCWVRAMDYFQDAHQHFVAAGDPAGEAGCLLGMAHIYYRLDDMASALLLYDDAIAAYRYAGDNPGTVQAVTHKAAALLALERPADAAAALDLADRLARDDAHVALRLKTRALLLIRQEALQEAMALLNEALFAAGDMGAAEDSSIHYAMGHVRMRQNQPAHALEAFSAALALDRAAGDHHAVAGDLAALGAAGALAGDHRQAVRHLERSARIYALLQDDIRLDAVLERLETSAAAVDADIGTTLYWVEQWRASGTGAVFCE